MLREYTAQLTPEEKAEEDRLFLESYRTPANSRCDLTRVQFFIDPKDLEISEIPLPGHSS